MTSQHSTDFLLWLLQIPKIILRCRGEASSSEIWTNQSFAWLLHFIRGHLRPSLIWWWWFSRPRRLRSRRHTSRKDVRHLRKGLAAAAAAAAAAEESAHSSSDSSSSSSSSSDTVHNRNRSGFLGACMGRQKWGWSSYHGFLAKINGNCAKINGIFCRLPGMQ